MRLILIEERVDSHPGLCQCFTGAPDIIVDFVEDTLWGDMSFVKPVDELIDTISQCTVFVVEILVQRVFL